MCLFIEKVCKLLYFLSGGFLVIFLVIRDLFVVAVDTEVVCFLNILVLKEVFFL